MCSVGLTPLYSIDPSQFFTKRSPEMGGLSCALKLSLACCTFTRSYIDIGRRQPGVATWINSCLNGTLGRSISRNLVFEQLWEKRLFVWLFDLFLMGEMGQKDISSCAIFSENLSKNRTGISVFHIWKTKKFCEKQSRTEESHDISILFLLLLLLLLFRLRLAPPIIRVNLFANACLMPSLSFFFSPISCPETATSSASCCLRSLTLRCRRQKTARAHRLRWLRGLENGKIKRELKALWKDKTRIIRDSDETVTLEILNSLFRDLKWYPLLSVSCYLQ